MTPLWRDRIESVIDADRFDLDDWHTAQAALLQLRAQDEAAGADFCGHPVQDSFLTLFKSAPRLAAPPAAQLMPLADLMARGMATPAWQQLRESALGDHVAAGIGAAAFVEETLAALPDEVKEAARQQAQQQAQADQQRTAADQTAADAQTLVDLLADLQAQYGDAVAPEATAEIQQQIAELKQQAAGARAQAQQIEAQAAQARAACQAGIEAQSAQIAAAMNHAAAAAQEQAQAAKDFVRGFSEAAGGDGGVVSPETARAAMEALRVNPNLKDLADLLGWARQMVRGEWRKSPRARTELVGYKTRPLQPAHLAGFEWAALLSGDATLELDWERRAIDGGLRHRQYGGQEKRNAGAMIIVRDESGSMAGSPHALAVALEWALLEIARRDKRPFYSIPFSGKDQFEVWTDFDATPTDLADHLSHFYSGGTELYGPLEEAIEIVNSSTGPEQRADILVITDGVFGEPTAVFQAMLAASRASGPLKIALVSVGLDNPHAHTFADPIIPVTDLLQDREQLRAAVAAIV